MNYFVTGATGFIGGRLVRELRRVGHQVTALVRDPERASALASLGVTLARGDVTDRASLRAPMQGADGLFHLGARAGHLDMIIDDPYGAVFDEAQFRLIHALARGGGTRQSQ